MKLKCKGLSNKKGLGQEFNQVKKNDKDYSPGARSYVKNLGSGKGLFYVKNELFILVEMGRETVRISIDDQFRKQFCKPSSRYAVLSEKRLGEIALSIPYEIEVEETGDPQHPYRVTDEEIKYWYYRILKNR